LKRLLGMKERFRFIGDVRGRGLLIGVELVKDRKTKEPLPKDQCRALFAEALRRGLISMCYSPAIRINPPLNVTAEEADEGADILEESFAELGRRFRL